MGRILWILPLCLLLQGQRCLQELGGGVDGSGDVQVAELSAKSYNPSETEKARNDILALLTIGAASDFPASVPWTPLYPIGSKQLFTLKNILTYRPTLFLQMCLDKQEREIHGYTVVFRKQERVAGVLHKMEKIKVLFQEKPFSVLFNWESGAGLAKKALFVEGKNDGYMRVRPNIPFLPVLSEKVDCAKAKAAGIYTIDQFGLRLATQRTVTSMRRAEAHGGLHVEYLGDFKVPELGGRECYKFLRTPYDPQEPEGEGNKINKLILYIDKELWLQVGSILKDEHDQLIGEYWFTDLQLNPTFPPDTFTEKDL